MSYLTDVCGQCAFVHRGSQTGQSDVGQQGGRRITGGSRGNSVLPLEHTHTIASTRSSMTGFRIGSDNTWLKDEYEKVLKDSQVPACRRHCTMELCHTPASRRAVAVIMLLCLSFVKPA